MYFFRRFTSVCKYVRWWFILCVFCQVFLKMAKYILIQTSLHSSFVFFLYIFSPVRLAKKYLMQYVWLMIYWSWNVEKYEKHARIEKCFSIFAKKCLWKYFCCLSFLSEDVAGNYHWKHSLCNCLKHVKSSILQRGNFKVLVIYTFISFSIQVQLDATSEKIFASWKMF